MNKITIMEHSCQQQKKYNPQENYGKAKNGLNLTEMLSFTA